MLSRIIAQLGTPRVYLALLLGASSGLLIYSYWLVDFLPPTSRSIILYTVLAALAGAVAYYLLLSVSALSPSDHMPSSARWIFGIGSILIGLYLTFVYLDGQGSSPRYVNFLLPHESLRLTVPAQANQANADVAITRFTTSLGDVSYGSLRYHGWSRNGSELVLTNRSDNLLEWSGRTGAEAMLSLRTSGEPLAVKISWNGQVQDISIPEGSDGRFEAPHSFSVPFYCSKTFLLVLGAFSLITLTYATNGLLWKNRETILAGLRQSASQLLGRPNEETARIAQVIESGRSVLRREWAIVAALGALALLLRIFNLDNLFPYADEYSHLLAARNLLQGAPLGSVFNRSLLTVTLPVLVSLRIFGHELWAARLPGVLLNAVAVIPLYLLTRKINRPIAILSGLLYASSPLIIGVSRNVREYAYYPIYFYMIVYAMALLLERLPNRLVMFRDWRIALRSDLRLLGVGVLLAPIYAVFVDPRSTFKIIMIAYAVFAPFLLRRFDLKSRANQFMLGLLGLGLAVGGSAYAILFGHSALSVAPNFHIDALAYFFPNPAQQWYADRLALIPILAIVVAGLVSLRSLWSNQVPAFLTSLFLACAVFFTTFFGHYLKPRYVTIMELWYVAVLGIGLYGLMALFSTVRAADVVLPLTATALFAVTFNVSQTLLPTFYDRQGNMPVTGEYHYNVGPAYAYLLDKVNPQDVLVSTIYGGYVRWKGVPHFREIDSYNSVLYSLQYKWIFPYEAAERRPETPQEYIMRLVASADSGWIVLDSITYSSSLARPLSLKSSTVDDKQIDYIGYFGGEYIWRWHAIQPSP